jgi:RNA polymerase sigma-70 factor, ECF subfamily
MRDQDQDAADAARVVAGDLGAFEGIVRRWQHRLVSLAWRFCRDRALAEDMAQEAFLKAYRALASFRGEAAFSTWLTSIAVNTYRTRLRAGGQPLLSLDPARIFAAGPGPLRGIEQRERAEAVRRAVLSLPGKYREAIVLYYFEEKDLAEAARVLDVAEGTLKARLHRGRELLKRRCGKLGLPAAGSLVEESSCRTISIASFLRKIAWMPRRASPPLSCSRSSGRHPNRLRRRFPGFASPWDWPLAV